MKPTKNRQKRRLQQVCGLAFVLFAGCALAVLCRIFWLQWVDGDALRAAGEARIYKTEELMPARGDILAEDGRVLATSLPFFELHMDMKASGFSNGLFEASVDSMALGLSRVFGDKSEAAYRAELRRKWVAGERYARLGNRDVDYPELEQLRRYPVFRESRNKGGLQVVRKFRRFKPLGDLASRTIGTVNAHGSVGLEDAYSNELQGEPGYRIVQKIPGQMAIPVWGEDQQPPREGLDVITTLDVNLQDVVSRALRQQLVLHNAHHGCVVVMEVATGQIRAMANLKQNAPGVYRDEVNYAVGESTEPGSTFKLASLIALLEDGLIRLEDSVNTGNGQMRIFDRVISDTKTGGWGKITVQHAWEVSSNVAVASLVKRYYSGREQDFVNRLYAMRLNQPLGFEIRGEGKPYVNSPGSGQWSGLSLPMLSIGYEVRQTPLQTLTLYNAVANGGRMMKPYLVKALADHGKVVRRFSPEVLEASICSRSTVAKVRQVLEGVVNNGTASNLRNADDSIAGKTGTAQIAHANRGYRQGNEVQYQASFVGYFPADAPRYSCIVVVSSPRQSGYYGNVVAGPIFREIVRKIYTTRREWFPMCADDGPVHPPASKAGDKGDLVLGFKQLGIRIEDDARGQLWVNTTKQPDKVRLSVRGESQGLVPDVVGMPLMDAVYLMENCGLRVHAVGRGAVQRQSVAAGTTPVRGSVVTLEMTVKD